MGGFCLLYPSHPNGIMKKLGAGAPTGLAGQMPLGATNAAADSPLYNMLAPSFGPPNTIPANITFAGKSWPVMPPPEPPFMDNATQFDQLWLEFNTGNPPPLLTAFGAWIGKGKIDDSPQVGALAQPGLLNDPPPVFPNASTALLYVASFPQDDGRRFGDGEAAPGVPLSHVPDNFWATSQIYLYDEKGQLPTVTSLNAGAEYYVSALIGNSSATGIAGRSVFTSNPMHVTCFAQCFNTFLSPGVALPSLGNLDPADGTATYDQYILTARTWDVAAFRFNVSKVFSDLAKALQGINIGGAQPADWLKAGHPCVKVMVTSGEQPNYFPPMGNVPLTIESSPRYDRHIDSTTWPRSATLMALKKPFWTNFILAQAGLGPNGLSIQQAGWPADAVHFYLAIPKEPYERYVAPAGIRGFEMVREGIPKPFPDAVILRQTTPGARLVIADHDPTAAQHRHGPDRFFGMALGIEADPARLRDLRSVRMRAAERLDGPVLLLVVHSAALHRFARLGRLARSWRTGRGADQRHQPGQRLLAVAQLAAVALGVQHQHAVVGQAAAGKLFQPAAHVVRQRRRAAHVEAKLYRRRGRVDMLAARTAGAHEALADLGRIEGERAGDPDRGGTGRATRAGLRALRIGHSRAPALRSSVSMLARLLCLA